MLALPEISAPEEINIMLKTLIITISLLLVLFLFGVFFSKDYKPAEFVEVVSPEEKRTTGNGAQKIGALESVFKEMFKEKYDEIYGGCWLSEDQEPFFAMTRVEKKMRQKANEIRITLVEVKYRINSC